MFARLADRFVMCPSRSEIPANGKSRRVIPFETGELEIWTERSTSLEENGGTRPALFVLKFNGAGGRAEKATTHPLDVWNDLAGEMWSANPPGYGASGGKASLRWLAPAAKAVALELAAVIHRDAKVIIAGNSLGTTTALYVAAHLADRLPIAGLILRNPPPLRELIAGKFGPRTLGVARLVARQIPSELDSVRNAALARVPAIFLCAGRDRVVPPFFQQLIVNSYAGPKRVITELGADHVFLFSQKTEREYGEALAWLRERMSA